MQRGKKGLAGDKTGGKEAGGASLSPSSRQAKGGVSPPPRQAKGSLSPPPRQAKGSLSPSRQAKGSLSPSSRQPGGNLSPSSRQPGGSLSPSSRQPGGNLSPSRQPRSPTRTRLTAETGKKDASPAKAKKVDAKDHAKALERDREASRTQVKELAEGILEGFVLGTSMVVARRREGLETLCREVLFWLDTSYGLAAPKDEYLKALGKVEGLQALAVAQSLEDTKEPPLPLAVFDLDQVIVCEAERQLEAAVKNSALPELRRLLGLEGGRAGVRTVDERGWSPLHHATALGEGAMVALLVREGAEVNLQAADGHTPLHLASGLGELEVMRTLLAAGAALDSTSIPLEWTALHMAAAGGKPEAARLLLAANAHPTAPALGNWTPASVAAMHGHTEVAGLLVKAAEEGAGAQGKGALPLELRTADGNLIVPGLRPDHVATCYRHPATAAKMVATEEEVEAVRAARREAKLLQARLRKPGGSGSESPAASRSPARATARAARPASSERARGARRAAADSSGSPERGRAARGTAGKAAAGAGRAPAAKAKG